MNENTTHHPLRPTKSGRWIWVVLGLTALLGIACSRPQVESDAATPADSVPGTVRATWTEWAGARSGPSALEHEIEHGLDTWSAEFKGDDGTVEITVLADGTLVALERDVDPDTLPADVAGAAATALGGAPERASHVRLAVYELENRTPSGALRERFVDPFGVILSDRMIDVGSENEAAESLEDLPAAARTAIENAAGGSPITGLARETERGRQVHAASWTAADGPRELKILDDGTVLSLELPTGELPEGVRSLTGAVVGDDEGESDESGAEPGEDEPTVERMLLDGWEVERMSGDAVRSVVVLPTGQTLGAVEEEPRDAEEGD